MIMPDKIGIIGNTHGVNASSKPKPKKLTKVKIKLSDAKLVAIVSCSDLVPCSTLGSISMVLALAASEALVTLVKLDTLTLGFKSASLMTFLTGG